MKKRIVAMLVALALLAGAGSVFAESGTVVVSGGTLAEAVTAVSLAGVTLDGTDQTTTDVHQLGQTSDPGTTRGPSRSC